MKSVPLSDRMIRPGDPLGAPGNRVRLVPGASGQIALKRDGKIVERFWVQRFDSEVPGE